jgi:cytochrome c553
MLLMMPLASQASPRTLELYDGVASLVPVVKHGATLYRRHCAACHGRRAFGDARKTVPALAGQVEPYLLKQLVDFVELDRGTPEMHRLMARRELGQPQAWRDIAAFLAGLPRTKRPEVGDGRNLVRGARSYGDFCAFCHGAVGEGIEGAPIPALRGQHYSYLLLQLRSFDTDHRLNVDAPLGEHMTGLSRDDLQGIADYLARMPSKPAGASAVVRIEPASDFLPKF